jgi:hypothetical protein
MDIDAEDLLKKATASKSTEESPKKKTVPVKVRFEESSPEKEEKEKPIKKTHLEKTLAKDYPGAEEETAKRMLTEGKMTLSYGEIFAISNGVVDIFKKKISNKRVPNEESGSSNQALVEGKEEEPSAAHYSCPLGYIKLNINGTDSKALLDTGSMVNLIPEHLAQQLGLVITEKPMNLKGIGGHHTGIIGIAEGVEVKIGQNIRPVHFWVARGLVQFILGKPFLIDAAATIRYAENGVESLAITDQKGKIYLIPILLPQHQKWETTLPTHVVTRNFSDQDWEFDTFKSFSVQLLGTTAKLGEEVLSQQEFPKPKISKFYQPIMNKPSDQNSRDQHRNSGCRRMEKTDQRIKKRFWWPHLKHVKIRAESSNPFRQDLSMIQRFTPFKLVFFLKVIQLQKREKKLQKSSTFNIDTKKKNRNRWTTE